MACDINLIKVNLYTSFINIKVRLTNSSLFWDYVTPKEDYIDQMLCNFWIFAPIYICGKLTSSYYNMYM